MIPLLLLFLAFGVQAGVHVRVGIAADAGRNAASVEGLPANTPGLADAVAKLLGCPVEPSFGGFRCHERAMFDGLEFSGRLDFVTLLTMPGTFGATATILLPHSPQSDVRGFRRLVPGWWPARVEFTGVPQEGRLVEYRLGFSWVMLLTDMAPLPILLYWLVRRPEPRWGWAAAMGVWLAWLGLSGTLALDSFFWYVPSLEGALLRWLSWLPLGLLIVAQARWMGMPLAAGVWGPIAVLVLLRPRSAHWMSWSEQLMADGISLALLGLVAGPMLIRGRQGAALPEPLLAALGRRGWHPGRYHIRLDQPAPQGAVSSARLGRVVTIPSAWLDRLRGEALESAVLLGCLRERFAPIALALAMLVALWVAFSLPAQRVPALIGLMPLAAWLGYRALEQRWERRVEREALRMGARPAALGEALLAMRPEWGEAAVRVAERLAVTP